MGSQLASSLRSMRATQARAFKRRERSTLDAQRATRVDKEARAASAADADEVTSLWHSSQPSGVAEAAQLIRTWAKEYKRGLGGTDVWRNWWRDQEVRALQIAYRLPAVWMFRAFGAEFENHRYGLHVRDYACYDGLHPNHDGRAEAMVADLAWNALRRGLHRARALPATSTYVPPTPLQTLPMRVGHVCFTFDAEGWDMLTGSRKTNRKLHEQSLIQTLAAPAIVGNRGWDFVMYEPQSRTPFKPGIVARTAGAQLRVEVDTSKVVGPSVGLQYLESKLGMGEVRIECAGCHCEGRRLDATGQVARLSTLVTSELQVTPHKRCELQFTVLNRTAQETQEGRGTKFKLARLFVTGSADMAADLAHLPPADAPMQIPAHEATRGEAMALLRAARQERPHPTARESLDLLLAK